MSEEIIFAVVLIWAHCAHKCYVVFPISSRLLLNLKCQPHIMVKHTNSSFKIQFINITKRLLPFLFLMIHWLVISGINLSELKKMSLILHFFQNIHRKKKWIWKTVWHQIVCTWLFKSSRWRYSAKIGFLQNRCFTKYQVDHVVKILGKCQERVPF